MTDFLTSGPAIASPPYRQFVDRYGLDMLKEPDDLQLVDGDLALTKDRDLMIGNKSYNALFRLVEYWRHNTPHLEYLFGLINLMVERYEEAQDRLEIASNKEAERKGQSGNFFSQSQEFLDAWHAHFDEEGSTIFGQLSDRRYRFTAGPFLSAALCGTTEHGALGGSQGSRSEVDRKESLLDVSRANKWLRAVNALKLC